MTISLYIRTTLVDHHCTASSFRFLNSLQGSQDLVSIETSKAALFSGFLGRVKNLDTLSKSQSIRDFSPSFFLRNIWCIKAQGSKKRRWFYCCISLLFAKKYSLKVGIERRTRPMKKEKKNRLHQTGRSFGGSIGSQICTYDQVRLSIAAFWEQMLLIFTTG